MKWYRFLSVLCLCVNYWRNKFFCFFNKLDFVIFILLFSVVSTCKYNLKNPNRFSHQTHIKWLICYVTAHHRSTNHCQNVCILSFDPVSLMIISICWRKRKPQRGPQTDKHLPQSPFTDKIFLITIFGIAFYQSNLSTYCPIHLFIMVLMRSEMEYWTLPAMRNCSSDGRFNTSSWNCWKLVAEQLLQGTVQSQQSQYKSWHPPPPPPPPF